MEYKAALRNNNIIKFVATRMDLEDIRLSEINQKRFRMKSLYVRQ